MYVCIICFPMIKLKRNVAPEQYISDNRETNDKRNPSYTLSTMNNYLPWQSWSYFLKKTSCYLIQELDLRFSGQHVLAPIIVQTINISKVLLNLTNWKTLSFTSCYWFIFWDEDQHRFAIKLPFGGFMHSVGVPSFVRPISVPTEKITCEQDYLCEFGENFWRLNSPRKSEPTRKLFIFKYHAFAEESSDLIG